MWYHMICEVWGDASQFILLLCKCEILPLLMFRQIRSSAGYQSPEMERSGIKFSSFHKQKVFLLTQLLQAPSFSAGWTPNFVTCKSPIHVEKSSHYFYAFVKYFHDWLEPLCDGLGVTPSYQIIGRLFEQRVINQQNNHHGHYLFEHLPFCTSKVMWTDAADLSDKSAQIG